MIAKLSNNDGKVYVNNIEITDSESWKKVIDSIKELQQENQQLKNIIDKAINFYENNKQECVIGRTNDEKLIKDYYLPAQLSKKLLDILKEVE